MTRTTLDLIGTGTEAPSLNRKLARWTNKAIEERVEAGETLNDYAASVMAGRAFVKEMNADGWDIMPVGTLEFVNVRVPVALLETFRRLIDTHAEDARDDIRHCAAVGTCGKERIANDGDVAAVCEFISRELQANHATLQRAKVESTSADICFEDGDDNAEQN